MNLDKFGVTELGNDEQMQIEGGFILAAITVLVNGSLALVAGAAGLMVATLAALFAPIP